MKFILNVGDSFYPDGLKGKDDDRWDIQWQSRYHEAVRSVPWYSVYGNHDTHHDPGMCEPWHGAQLNGDLHDLSGLDSSPGVHRKTLRCHFRFFGGRDAWSGILQHWLET